jgi:membrane protease YdiL (CAAX protease family)
MALILISWRQIYAVHMQPRSAVQRVLAIQTSATPFVASTTYAFARLRPEDYRRWSYVLFTRGVSQATLGAGMGTSAFFIVVLIATSRGWVSYPARTRQQLDQGAIAQNVLIQLAHLNVAWNEETIFRGYGLETLTQAMGRLGAVCVLTPLFALAHGPGWQVFLGQSAFGVAMTMLRLSSGSIWLPIGYHFAWNYVQTAILGDPDQAATVRPMQLIGPRIWIGQQGQPEPGILEVLVHLSIATIVSILYWRKTQR